KAERHVHSLRRYRLYQLTADLARCPTPDVDEHRRLEAGLGDCPCNDQFAVTVAEVAPPSAHDILRGQLISASLAAASERVSGSNASSATMLRRASAAWASSTSASLAAASKR